MKSSAPAAPAMSLHRWTHSSASGFCAVCGTVWPCSTAAREDVQPQRLVPVAR